ncbi:hypothetical protein ACN47E_003879 [Coniothyrium glycines]
MTSRALTLSALVALSQAKAIVTNNCPHEVYIWSVPRIGASHTQNLPIRPGGRYEEPWRRGTSVTPGIALKISSEPDGINKGASEIDFAYSVDNLDASSIWLDLSSVRKVPVDKLSFYTCHGLFQSADISTQKCHATDDIELVLCGSGRTGATKDTTPLTKIEECYDYHHFHPKSTHPSPKPSSCGQQTGRPSCHPSSASMAVRPLKNTSSALSLPSSNSSHHTSTDITHTPLIHTSKHSYTGPAPTTLMLQHGPPCLSSGKLHCDVSLPLVPTPFSLKYTAGYSAPKKHADESKTRPPRQSSYEGYAPPKHTSFISSPSRSSSHATYATPMSDPQAYAPPPHPMQDAPGHIGPFSIDGTCGATKRGQTCFGFHGLDGLAECCSEYGWCGNSELHCGARCQAGYGRCGISHSSPSAGSKTAYVSYFDHATTLDHPHDYQTAKPTFNGSFPPPAHTHKHYSFVSFTENYNWPQSLEWSKYPGPTPVTKGSSYTPPHATSKEWYHAVPSTSQKAHNLFSTPTGTFEYQYPSPLRPGSQTSSYAKPLYTHEEVYPTFDPTSKSSRQPYLPQKEHTSDVHDPFIPHSWSLHTRPSQFKVGKPDITAHNVYAPPRHTYGARDRTCHQDHDCDKIPVQHHCMAKVVYPTRRGLLLKDRTNSSVPFLPKETVPLDVALRHEVAKGKFVTVDPKATSLCSIIKSHNSSSTSCNQEFVKARAREIFPHLCEPMFGLTQDACVRVKRELKKAYVNVDKVTSAQSNDKLNEKFRKCVLPWCHPEQLGIDCKYAKIHLEAALNTTEFTDDTNICKNSPLFSKATLSTPAHKGTKPKFCIKDFCMAYGLDRSECDKIENTLERIDSSLTWTNDDKDCDTVRIARSTPILMNQRRSLSKAFVRFVRRDKQKICVLPWCTGLSTEACSDMEADLERWAREDFVDVIYTKDTTVCGQAKIQSNVTASTMIQSFSERQLKHQICVLPWCKDLTKEACIERKAGLQLQASEDFVDLDFTMDPEVCTNATTLRSANMTVSF